MEKVKNTNKIKTLRDYLGLSQAAFAKPLDLSPTHIARFEQGIAKPSQSTIDRICEKFGVDPRYFGTSQLSQPLSQRSRLSSATGSSEAQLSGVVGASEVTSEVTCEVEPQILVEQAVKRVTEDDKNKEIGKRVREGQGRKRLESE